LPPSKGLQSTSHFFVPPSPIPDSSTIPPPADKLIYWTPDGKLTAAQYAEYTPREWAWADAWTLPTHNSREIADSLQAFTDEIRELHMDFNEETGAMILRDRNGNVVTSDERREVSVWDHLRAGRRDEFFEELEANPGSIWRFDFGEEPNRDFAGHDILNAIFPKVYQSVTSRIHVTDEYGYTFHVPAFVPNENFTTWSIGTHDQNGEPLDTIVSMDKSGLGGLTLEERDLFFAEVQKIFDQNGVQADARKESYLLLPATPKDMPQPIVGCNGQPLPEDFVWTPFPGGWQWGGGIDWIDAPFDRTTLLNVQDEILGNSVLRSLFEKAENVRTGVIADDTLAQQYLIRVMDDNGNRLANDRIIVEARNGNQIEMSVEQFSNMSRLDITKLLR